MLVVASCWRSVLLQFWRSARPRARRSKKVETFLLLGSHRDTSSYASLSFSGERCYAVQAAPCCSNVRNGSDARAVVSFLRVIRNRSSCFSTRSVHFATSLSPRSTIRKFPTRPSRSTHSRRRKSSRNRCRESTRRCRVSVHVTHTQ